MSGKDPWRSGEQEPPDLDEVFKKLFKKFGGQTKNTNGTNSTKINKNVLSKGFGGLGFIAAVLLFFYALSGVYIVDPAEQAVVTRFGRFVRTENSGPHWYARFLENKKIVNVQQVYTIENEERMLTKDENIVSVEIAVQYRVRDPKAYLFNVVEPENTLKQATEAALRIVIGHSTLDEILTSGRTEIVQKIQKLSEEIIDTYQLGLQISDVAMQPARAPNEVKEAFDDVIKAQEDEIREVNRAETYARKIEPIARGNAKRLIEEANAYRKEIVFTAKGRTARFLKVLPEYKRAPEITKRRLYLEAMEDIFSAGNRVIVDSKQQNFLYLPLDKWVASASTNDVEESDKTLPPLLPQTRMGLIERKPDIGTEESTASTQSAPQTSDRPRSRMSRGEMRALRETRS